MIEEVRSGRNLVVQGPPGTGKSQTITNIIAAAAKEGKRVLFLAEKMAALSVVHDRLVKVGLRDVCLELHSRSANKKAVLSELARTLSQASVVPEVPGAPTAVRESRDRLNNLAGALHRPIGATGETAYRVLGRQIQYIGKGIAPPSLEVESLSSMSRQQEIDLLVTIEEYGALLAEEGRATTHPFEGTGNLLLQPVDLARLKATLTEAQAAVTSLAASLRVPVDTLALHGTAALDIVAPLADVLGRLEGLPLGAADIAQKVLEAPDIPRLHQALRAGMAWRQALDQASEVFVETAFSISSSHLRAPLAAGIRSFFARWGGRYRGASRELAGLLRGGLAEHARANPSHSLGVVTFSFAQRNLITELLELRRRQDSTLDQFLREGQSEDLFVKNIENVQGDERDVILVSVGYGPVIAGGRLNSMSFGPVNGEGGERRLNVLFTRARIRCEVFASFDPGDIDLNRTSREGPRILKRFLDFAKNGRLEVDSPTGLDADSPFEEDVADVIRGCGFLADAQVGSVGFRIDLGIRHPDRPGSYILAVECDGATYHSALWARERDRLRQDVLEHLGWRFHRIWSTDWFYNRHFEIERLRTVLSEARDRSDQGPRVEGANQARSIEPAEVEATPILVPEVVVRQMPPYQRAFFRVSTSNEPHEAPVSMLANLARRIVDAEGPIHVEEIARRVASCFGKEKAGSRILTATESALSVARSGSADLLTDGIFWYTRGRSDAPAVRDRSAESGATIKAACISILEIQAAFMIAREDNAGGEDEELVRTVARLLGFKRVGADLQARLAEGLT